MIFQWPAQKPELQGHSRRARRRQSAENIALGGYMNMDGTFNESFQKAIANEPLPQPVNPFGRPVLPKREAHAPRYKKLGQQLRDNAIVRKRIPNGDDDSLAAIIGTDAKGGNIFAPRGFEPVWDDDMETVIGHMDWQNGIAVPLGHAFPTQEGSNNALENSITNPESNGRQVAAAISIPYPLPPPVAPGQTPEEGGRFPQGPGTIPMDQAQEIEKWILDKIQGLKESLPGDSSDESNSKAPTPIQSDNRPDTPASATIMESRDARNSGKKAGDSGKNEPHGDGGRAIEKAKRREHELEQEIQDAPNKKEKKRLKDKAKNIRKNAHRRKKGEHHGQKGKGNN